MNAPTRFVTPVDLALAAVAQGSGGIAFTYTEPTIWFEYILETAPLARAAGGIVVMVSNGFVETGPLEEYIGVTDAWNIDLKGWSREFYRSRCGGELDVVLRSLARVAASGKHLEVTFLVIPGENDNEKDWVEMASWLSDYVGRSVPLHISRYFPRYRMKNPATPVETIARAVEIFSGHLDFVYPGNLNGECNTRCPFCGSILIRRDGYTVKVTGINAGQCSQCGRESGVILG